MCSYYIIGHKNPDTDSICAAISLEYFNKKVGRPGTAARLGDANSETKFVIDYLRIDLPQLLWKAQDNYKLILVDHNEKSQSIDNININSIIQVIDHHRIGNFYSLNPINFRCEPLGSTCSIIFKLFRENNIEIPGEISLLLLSGILSDTLIFRSPTCTQEDIEIANNLANIAKVSVKEFGLSMLKAGTNLDTSNTKKILRTDSKEFSERNIRFLVSQINIASFEQIEEIYDKIVKDMEEVLNKYGYEFVLLLATNIVSSDTKAIVVGNSNIVAEAFNVDKDDKYIYLPGVVSRKKQVIPVLADYLHKF